MLALKTDGETAQWDAAAAKAAAEESLRHYGVASEHTTLLLLHEAVQVRRESCEGGQARCWADGSPSSLCSHRNAWANMHR